MTHDAGKDLALLRQYEPVICYTLGELYFPCAVDEYVRRSSLWLRPPEGDPVQLADWGELTLDKLAAYSEIPDRHSLFLRFVEEPMDVIEYGRWRQRSDRPPFHAPGRLARVGIFPRIIDSLFDLSLLIRGTVPGGTDAAAYGKYAAMQQSDPRRVYYGRVLRVGGYTVLHYLFFYAMNDWRSAFFGINDHESDWEQVFIYLSGKEDELAPRWVAFASHDYEGDDLRRRWDDPDLTLVEGRHPVVYAGAGSHASYFLPGEYLMGVQPQFLQRVQTAVDRIADFWTNRLGQGASAAQEEAAPSHGLVSIPFVDYARGDGPCIGPGQDEGWTPVLICDEIPWVAKYRGLWGLETNDPFGGERAPSGPRYNRNGSVRKSWYDPLGWAGLAKVTPPEELIPALERQIEGLRSRGQALEAEIRSQVQDLRRVTLEVAALQESEFVAAIEAKRAQKRQERETALNGLYAERVHVLETQRAMETYLDRVRRGDLGDPQAHLRRQHRPAPPVTQMNRAAELWSAISAGLLLLLVAALVIFHPPYWPWLLMGIVFVFFALEATARNFLSRYLLNVSILLAIVSLALLLYTFWLETILAAIVALVIFMMHENLRELRYSGGRPAPPREGTGE